MKWDRTFCRSSDDCLPCIYNPDMRDVMRTPWFRIVCAIVLISFVTMFSGLTSITSAAQSEIIETASSNHCSPDKRQECPIPCETQVCPLCICSTADAVLPIEIQTSIHIIEFKYPDIQQLIPDPFVSEIFRPPKHLTYCTMYVDTDTHF